MNKLLKLFAVFFILIIGCGKNNDSSPKYSINETEVKLNFDKTFDFKIQNATNVEWSSSDEFVGIVDIQGKFIAKHVGETIITAKVNNETITSKVIVEPYISNITEPIIAFGKSIDEVKSLEKRTIFITDNGALTYYEKDLGRFVFYPDIEVKGIVDLLTIRFLFAENPPSEIVKFYAERYKYIGNFNHLLNFESRDGKTAVKLGFFDASMGLFSYYYDIKSEERTKIFTLNFKESIHSGRTEELIKLSEIIPK